MKQNSLKSLLHESIENINDEDFLLAIKQLLDRKYVPTEKIKLSKAQVQRINESKSQIAEGKFLTNSQADKLVDKWLKK